MRQCGFTLVELLVVISIMAILLGLGTLQFNAYTKKANIEKEVRILYAELMNARAQAFMTRSPRSVAVTAVPFSVYPTADGTGTALVQQTFKYAVTSDTADLVSFDLRGVANAAKTICVGPATNPAVIDSIQIYQTIIRMGKLTTGGACTSANFNPK